MRQCVRILTVSSAVLMAGCATVTLPRGPNVSALTRLEHAPTLIVLKPLDQRTDKKRLGSIGLTQFSMNEDPTELVANELVAALHARGVNGVLSSVSSQTPEASLDEVRQANADGVLATTIDAIKMESFDIILDPPTTRLSLNAVLYDPQGTAVARTSATGEVRKPGMSFSLEKMTGQLVAKAAHDAAERLTGQGQFASAVADLRSRHQIPQATVTEPTTEPTTEDGTSVPEAVADAAESTQQEGP